METDGLMPQSASWVTELKVEKVLLQGDLYAGQNINN